MSFRDLQARRMAYASQARRARALSYLLALIFGGLVGFGGVAIWRGTRVNDLIGPPPEDALSLSFGFDREPISRNFMLELDAPGKTSLSASDEVIGVRLVSDLRQEDRAAEFPAEQLTVGITRLSPTRVNLAVTANPWAPEKVVPGRYTGTLELSGSGVSRTVPISIWLRNREHKWAAVAFALLTLGASLGLVVKWITERLTPQAALVRRLATLKQTIGFREDVSTLPVGVRLQLQQLEDEIEREDYAAAETSFKKLVPDAEQYAVLSSQFAILLDQLSGQARLIEEGTSKSPADLDSLLLEAVLDSEYRAIQEPLADPREEPEKDKQLLERARKLRQDFGHVQHFIAEYIENPGAAAPRAALQKVQAGLFDESLATYATELQKGTPDKPVHRSARAPPRKRTGRKSRLAWTWNERARIKFQFRRARTLAGLGSVLLVSLAGLKLQYLDDQRFDGTLSAWIGLLLWAAVVELSGVAVLDVLGRLGTNAPRVHPASP